VIGQRLETWLPCSDLEFREVRGSHVAIRQCRPSYVGCVVIRQCCETVGCHYVTGQRLETWLPCSDLEFREVRGSHVAIRQCRPSYVGCVVRLSVAIM
jgi:ribulose bisphosphate carboxylase small subunit